MSRQVFSVGATANDHSGDNLHLLGTKLNSNFAEIYEGLFTRVFDVVQYGAVFDVASDIKAAVQAAIDAARVYLSAGSYRAAEIVFPQGCPIGRIYSTLDFTRFTNKANMLTVRWNRIGVLAYTSGKPAIDALGSININWRGVHISGSGGATSPNYGIQFGRINTMSLNSGGNSMAFFDCRLVDSFTGAALYNFSGESCYYLNCQFHNALGYAAILDGINHFGVTSDYVTQSAPANTSQSFNQNLFVRCSFSGGTGATDAAIWQSGCRQHEFQSCYGYCPGSWMFHKYYVTGAPDTENKYDIHAEGTATTPLGYFLLDGTLANPVIGGVEIKVAFIYANRLFKAIGSITSMTARNMRISMAGEIYSAYSATFQVFDNAAIWTVNGARVDIVSAAYWNYAASQSVTVNGIPHITFDMA